MKINNVISNSIKVIIILVTSFIILAPFVYLLNKSYYATISKVNYYELKELIPFVKYYLENNVKKNSVIDKSVIEDIDNKFSNISFFMIEFRDAKDRLVYEKTLYEKYTPNRENPTRVHLQNGFSLIFYPRIYKSWRKIYGEYVHTLLVFNLNDLFYKGELLVIFTVHIVVILLCICAIMWLTAFKYSRTVRRIYNNYAAR